MEQITLFEQMLGRISVLRQLGVAVSPDRVVLAMRAVQLLGMEDRHSLKCGLKASLIAQPDDIPAFEFWFSHYIEALDSKSANDAWSIEKPQAEKPQAPSPVADDSLGLASRSALAQRYLASAHTSIEQLDVGKMVDEQVVRVLALIRQESWRLGRPRKRSFRWTLLPASAALKSRSRISMRASLRSSFMLQSAGVRYELQNFRPAHLVFLVDVSKSMGQYAQVFFSWLYQLALHNRDRLKLQVFAMSTELVDVSKAFRADDYSGFKAALTCFPIQWNSGTRLTECFAAFAGAWKRSNINPRKSTGFLLTDGMESDMTSEKALQLESASGELAQCFSALLWLNPLLRFAGFEPKASSIQAIAPQVDALLPVHNIESLRRLFDGLSQIELLTNKPFKLKG